MTVPETTKDVLASLRFPNPSLHAPPLSLRLSLLPPLSLKVWNFCSECTAATTERPDAGIPFQLQVIRTASYDLRPTPASLGHCLRYPGCSGRIFFDKPMRCHQQRRQIQKVKSDATDEQTLLPIGVVCHREGGCASLPRAGMRYSRAMYKVLGLH